MKQGQMSQRTRMVDFLVKGDERGALTVLENATDSVPFAIKRVYYIWGTQPGVVRGKHGHYKLCQLLVSVCGSCDIALDDGFEKKLVRLDSPSRGVLIDGPIWHEMLNFSPDCVLLVLASDVYNEADYIRDYDRFLEEVH